MPISFLSNNFILNRKKSKASQWGLFVTVDVLFSNFGLYSTQNRSKGQGERRMHPSIFNRAFCDWVLLSWPHASFWGWGACSVLKSSGTEKIINYCRFYTCRLERGKNTHWYRTENSLMSPAPLGLGFIRPCLNS